MRGHTDRKERVTKGQRGERKRTRGRKRVERETRDWGERGNRKGRGRNTRDWGERIFDKKM